MKKKFFAVALATTMALSTAITASAETLTGTKWWDGMQAGQDYTLSGDGSVSLDVAFTAGDDAGYGAFNVEVYADKWYLTTGSDQNAWYAEGAKDDANSNITGVATEFASTIVAGNTYKVTVKKAGTTITVTYLNPDGSTYAEYVGTNSTTPNDLKIHVLAQVGTYEVTEAAAAGTTPTGPEAAKPTTTAGTTTTAAKTTTAATTKTTTPKTADVAPVAALAALGVVACAGVVVSRKKVTE